MTRYYRIIRDHPLWDVGAVLKKDNADDCYRAVSDIWTKELDTDFSFDDYHEGKELVENQPEWFERVYEVSVLGKVKYMTKEAAKNAHNSLYKEKK